MLEGMQRIMLEQQKDIAELKETIKAVIAVGGARQIKPRLSISHLSTKS